MRKLEICKCWKFQRAKSCLDDSLSEPQHNCLKSSCNDSEAMMLPASTYKEVKLIPAPISIRSSSDPTTSTMTPRELTPEEWRGRLHQNPKPPELLEPLHSLDAKDKNIAEFLEISQDKTNNESTDKDNEAKEIADLEYLARALANTGDGVYAQEIRLLLFKRQLVAEIEQNLLWAQNIIEADIKGRYRVEGKFCWGGASGSLCGAYAVWCR